MTNYIVRTIVGFEADDPLEATDLYKRYLAEHDPDGLVYRVQNEGTGELLYVYRNQVMTLDEIEEYLNYLDQEDDDEGT